MRELLMGCPVLKPLSVVRIRASLDGSANPNSKQRLECLRLGSSPSRSEFVRSHAPVGLLLS